jgi:hypothetical protein
MDRQQTIFVAFDLEQAVPESHPLRKIKRWADQVLAQMNRDFNNAYSPVSRPGIPPERCRTCRCRNRGSGAVRSRPARGGGHAEECGTPATS